MSSEANIQDLLEKIRREGVEEANRLKEEILEQARAQASQIVEDARREAEVILSRGREELERRRRAFEEEVSLAARDLILGVRQGLISLMDRVLRRRIRDALTPEFLRNLIMKAVEKWAPHADTAKLEVLLNQRDLKRLEQAAVAAIQEGLKEGVHLRPFGGIEAGFRLGEVDGSVHYDFTDEAILEVFSEYLHPRMAEFLKGSKASHEGST